MDESCVEPREAFLDKERWKTAQLMGAVNRPWSERLVMVHRIVYFEVVWAAQTEKVVFARQRARVNKVELPILSALLII